MDELKFSGFTVIMTSKMKDEYAGDSRTGRVLPRIFKDIPYRADLMVSLLRDPKGAQRFITKSGWTMNGNGDNPFEIPPEIQTLPQIIEFAKTLDALPVQANVPAESALAIGGTGKTGGKKVITGQ
jgi:hypothetical protein